MEKYHHEGHEGIEVLLFEGGGGEPRNTRIDTEGDGEILNRES